MTTSEQQLTTSPVVVNDGLATTPPSVSEVAVARMIRSAVRVVPGVYDLGSGRFVEAATYGSNETVAGVVVASDGSELQTEVHVTAIYSDQMILPELADRIRNAIRQAVGDSEDTRIRRIDVVFEDLRMEPVSP